MKERGDLKDLFQQRLLELREAKLLEEELARTSLEEDEFVYWDLDELLASDNPELEKRLTGWLDRGAAISERDWSDDSEQGQVHEKLAWYQPITFYGEDSGIFITTRGLQLYGSRHWSQLIASGVPNSQAVRLALWAAYNQLLGHEMFHHQVEWMSFRFELTLGNKGTRRYSKYFKDEYQKSFSTGALEEALASASEIRDFPRTRKALGLERATRGAIMSSIEDGFVNRPPGYRDAGIYLQDRAFEIAVGKLLNMVEGTKLQSAAHLLPQIGVQHSDLQNYFAKSAAVVERKKAPAVGQTPLTFNVPDRKLRKLLSGEGYAPTGRGKGSHEVWAKPDHPNVTIPYRTNQEGLMFLKTTAKALGLRNLRELEELVRSV